MKNLLFIIIPLLLFSCEKEEEPIPTPTPEARLINPPQWMHGTWKNMEGNKSLVISNYQFLFTDNNDASKNLDLNTLFDSITKYPGTCLFQNLTNDYFELDINNCSDTSIAKQTNPSYYIKKIHRSDPNQETNKMDVSTYRYEWDNRLNLYRVPGTDVLKYYKQ